MYKVVFRIGSGKDTGPELTAYNSSSIGECSRGIGIECPNSGSHVEERAPTEAQTKVQKVLGTKDSTAGLQ